VYVFLYIFKLSSFIFSVKIGLLSICYRRSRYTAWRRESDFCFTSGLEGQAFDSLVDSNCPEGLLEQTGLHRHLNSLTVHKERKRSTQYNNKRRPIHV